MTTYVAVGRRLWVTAGGLAIAGAIAALQLFIYPGSAAADPDLICPAPGVGCPGPGVLPDPGPGGPASGVGVLPGAGAGAPGLGVLPGPGVGEPGLGIIPDPFYFLDPLL